MPCMIRTEMTVQAAYQPMARHLAFRIMVCMNAMAEKKYTFLVHPDANKTMIKEAVERMFFFTGSCTKNECSEVLVRGEGSGFGVVDGIAGCRVGDFSIGRYPSAAPL